MRAKRTATQNNTNENKDEHTINETHTQHETNKENEMTTTT